VPAAGGASGAGGGEKDAAYLRESVCVSVRESERASEGESGREIYGGGDTRTARR